MVTAGRKAERRAETHPPLAGPGRRHGRSGPPAGPRTWRRCCVPSGAMVPVQSCLARAAPHDVRRAPVPACHGRGRGRSPARPAARYSGSASGASARQRGEVRLERPEVAAGDRPGQRGADAEGPGVAQRPLDERAVDREGAGLVETGDPAELGDRVEQRDEAAGREDRRRVVGRLRAGRQADRRARRAPRPCRPAGRPAGRRASIATVAPWSAATARSVSAKATSGWNAPTWVPAAMRRREDLGVERAAGVDHRLPAVHPDRPGERRDGVVGDGDDDQLDLLDEGLRLGERADAVDLRAEPLAAGRVAAGDRLDRPAGPAQGDPEGGPDRARPDDPDDRRLARLGVLMRVLVVARVDVVAVAVVARRGRVEVDAGRLDRRLGLGVRSASSGPRRAARPTPSSAGGRDGRTVAVRLHPSSVASQEESAR